MVWTVTSSKPNFGEIVDNNEFLQIRWLTSGFVAALPRVVGSLSLSSTVVVESDGESKSKGQDVPLRPDPAKKHCPV